MDIEELDQNELNQLLLEEELKENALEYEVKNFGELVEGDFIEGPDGLPVQVSTIYDKHLPEKMYEIELETGEKIKVSGNHLWYIESANNLAMFHLRVKETRKYLKEHLKPEDVDRLLEIANSDEQIETALIDMVAATNSVNNSEGIRLISRIASSLGKVSDNHEILKNYETDEIIGENNLPYYDGVLFCQQILALYSRKYAKKWKIRKGEVVTTEELVNFYDTVDLPVVKQIN